MTETLDPNLYLKVNLFSIIVPFIASFYPKAPFYKEWKYALPGIVIAGFIFILWDAYFTKIGVWGFNPAYLKGIYFLNLPIEEWLFFLCIPYACLFTYFALNHLIKKDLFIGFYRPLTLVLILGSLVLFFLKIEAWYTATTFLGLALLLSVHYFYLKRSYLSRFYFTFVIILLPFFITNGILTGSWIKDQVVWYNNAENLGIRMGTIPVEDTFYGMFLLLLGLTLYEELKKKFTKNPI